MAYINKNVSTMAMPSGMNRMGQFPLDMSSVYYDLDSLQAYATSGAVAYVGQILSLVNETDKTVTLYAIKNTDGDLVQIGTDIAIPEVPEYSGEGAVNVADYKISVAVDNETIKIVDGKLTAIIPEVEIPEYVDTDTKTKINGSDYVTVEGAFTENTTNTYTISINEEKLKALIGSETTAAMEFKGATNSLPENAQKGDIYKVSATFIVDSENNAESDDADPSGFVTEIGDSIVAEGNGKWYLIPSGDDIEDTWRPVTSVNNDATLTFNAGEVLEVSVAATGEIAYKHKEIAAPTETTDETGARKYLTGIETDDYGHITGFTTAEESVVDTDTTYTLSAVDATIILTPSEGDAQSVALNVYTKGQTDQAIADKINEVNGGESAGEVLANLNAYKKNLDTELWGFDKVTEWTGEDGKYNPDYTAASRLDAVEVKVLNIENGAQVNKIESADPVDFVVTETKELKIIDGKSLITAAQVAKLDGIEAGAQKNYISDIDALKFTVTEGKLFLKENYVTTTVYSAEVGDLTQLVRDEGRENTTLVDEINYINERLTWGEMV